MEKLKPFLVYVNEYRAELVMFPLAVIEWFDMDMDVVNDYLMGAAIVLLILYRAMKIYKLRKKKKK